MTSQESVEILETLIAVFAGKAQNPPPLADVQEAIEVIVADIAEMGGRTITKPELSKSSGALSIDKETARLVEALLKWYFAVKKAASEKADFEAFLSAKPRFNGVRNMLRI